MSQASKGKKMEKCMILMFLDLLDSVDVNLAIQDRLSHRGVVAGGATGAMAPPIFWTEGGNSDVITLMTSSLHKDHEILLDAQERQQRFYLPRVPVQPAPKK